MTVAELAPNWWRRWLWRQGKPEPARVFGPVFGRTFGVFERAAVAAVTANGLLTGLLAYWTMEEASGDRADSSGSGLTLSASGTVPSRTGISGDGADVVARGTGYLYSTADDAKLRVPAARTWACWIYLDNLPSAGYPMSHWGSGGDFCIYVSAAGAVACTLMGSGVETATTPDSTVATAGWYFLCAWYDPAAGANGTGYIQVNAGTVYTVALGAAHVATAEADFCIGPLRSNYGDWDGAIDEVGIWDRVLSADDRIALYNGGAGLTYADFTV